jgi:hypothetical protein
MDSLEIQAYDLLKKHGRMSPALLASKLKITFTKAEELCLLSWQMQAEEWFRFRSGFEYEDLLAGVKC